MSPAGKLDPEAMAAGTRRRVTRRLIPYLMFLYLLAYLDRVNLSIAKIGMQRDLGFDDAVIGFGAGIFFLGYLLLDIPGSLIVERWSARKWIARIMVTWGMIAAVTAFLGASTRQFYLLRFSLGLSEAGFFPGVVVFLSHWYRAADRPRAKAYFMVTQPIAVALGLPVSRLIMENVHWLGWAGWRWVFILEGIPPVVMGVITWFYLTDRPAQARWLPDDEREWLRAELAREEAAKVAAGKVRMLDALRHAPILLLAASFFLMITGNQALIFFLPSIMDNMKSVSIPARTAMTAAPYVCSAAGILLNGLWAQRTGKLRWHTCLPMIATGISLSLAILSAQYLPAVIACFCLAGLTSQAYLPALWSLPSTLLGKSAAALAIGFINLANIGGFVGPYLFGYLRTTTGSYEAGLWFLAACMIAAGLIASRVGARKTETL